MILVSITCAQASRALGLGGAGVDLIAKRVLFRTGPNSGSFVDFPVPGQTVFFHVVWESVGLPSSVMVSLRAELDGALFCGGTAAAPGEEVGTWCTTGWTVAEGRHTLRWIIDRDNDIAEVDETNNVAIFEWDTRAPPTATATPTPVPPSTATRTSTPTRTRTNTPPAVFTPTHTPASNATSTRTRTPTTARSPGSDPTPTSTGGAEIEGAFARGDANCSLRFTAADVVATARGVQGEPLCGNDDCDRNGVLDVADVDCAALCLFGTCAIPPHAPHVMDVQPETAPGIATGSIIRVNGVNLGSPDNVRRVTIGGREAEVVDLITEEDLTGGSGARGGGPSGETLTVAVPVLEEGTHDLVVFNGEIAGPPMAIEVSPPVPIGARDGLQDLLDLLDELVVAFLGLDLSTAFGEEELPILLQLANDYRAALASVDLEGLPPELLTEIDALVDGSGLPESTREVIAEIRSQRARAPRGLAPVTARTIQVTRNWLIFVRATPTTIIQFTPAAAATPAYIALGALAVKTAVFAGAVVALYKGLEFAVTPVIVDWKFFDADSSEVPVAVPGGRVQVKTGNAIDVGIDLLANTAYPREIRLQGEACRTNCEGESCETNCREYTLPVLPGFCGRALFRLARGTFVSEHELSAAIRPVLISLFPNQAEVEDPLELLVSGVRPCESRIVYTGPEPSTEQVEVRPLGESGESNVLVTLAGVPPLGSDPQAGALAELPPGRYGVRVQVQDQPSAESEPLEFRTLIRGLRLTCPSNVIRLDELFRISCTAETTPEGARFPEPFDLSFSVTEPGGSTPDDVIVFRFQSTDDLSHKGFRFIALQPGVIRIKATLAASGTVLAESNVLEITLTDPLAPTIESLETTPPCGSTLRVGDSVAIEVEARDNVPGLFRIRVKADQGERRVFEDGCLCPAGSLVCSASFEMPILDTFEMGELQLEIEVEDRAGNETDRTCIFQIEVPVVDVSPPQVTLTGIDPSCPACTSPPCPPCAGAAAGDLIEVRAEAVDDIEMEKIRVTTPLDGVSNPEQALYEFDCPPGSTICAQVFSIRLREGCLAPPEVTVTATAFDAGSNTSEPAELRFTIQRPQCDFVNASFSISARFRSTEGGIFSGSEIRNRVIGVGTGENNEFAFEFAAEEETATFSGTVSPAADRLETFMLDWTAFHPNGSPSDVMHLGGIDVPLVLMSPNGRVLTYRLEGAEMCEKVIIVDRKQYFLDGALASDLPEILCDEGTMTFQLIRGR
jgi:hypothetical protein